MLHSTRPHAPDEKLRDILYSSILLGELALPASSHIGLLQNGCGKTFLGFAVPRYGELIPLFAHPLAMSSTFLNFPGPLGPKFFLEVSCLHGILLAAVFLVALFIYKSTKISKKKALLCKKIPSKLSEFGSRDCFSLFGDKAQRAGGWGVKKISPPTDIRETGISGRYCREIVERGAFSARGDFFQVIRRSVSSSGICVSRPCCRCARPKRAERRLHDVPCLWGR